MFFEHNIAINDHNDAMILSFSSWLFACYALRRFISLDEHGGSKASQGKQ